MRCLPLLVPPVTAVLLASCSSIRVERDYDTAFDFSKLKTYAWIAKPGQDDEARSLDERRIRETVDAELAARGYGRVETGPDFLVAYYAGRQSKIDVRESGYHYPYPRYRGDWYYGPSRLDVRTYEEGTLVLDLIDAGQKSVIWRGTATAVLSARPTPAEREQRIREAVQKLLAEFPPAAGKR